MLTEPESPPPDVSANERLSTTEADLVRRAQAGDVDAFGALYRRHVGRVYAVCVRMSGDPRTARELTQDAFVRCWERLGSFRLESGFGSWLHRVAVNVVLEEFRRTKRREARVQAVDDLGGAFAASRRDRVDERIDLAAAVAQLPEGARMVFVLHDIEGYKHDEISRMTGLASGTLRAQLHRARKLLQKAMT